MISNPKRLTKWMFMFLGGRCCWNGYLSKNNKYQRHDTKNSIAKLISQSGYLNTWRCRRFSCCKRDKTCQQYEDWTMLSFSLTQIEIHWSFEHPSTILAVNSWYINRDLQNCCLAKRHASSAFHKLQRSSTVQSSSSSGANASAAGNKSSWRLLCKIISGECNKSTRFLLASCEVHRVRWFITDTGGVKDGAASLLWRFFLIQWFGFHGGARWFRKFHWNIPTTGRGN